MMPPNRFRTFGNPAFRKKQEFKVLAILWHTWQRKQGALTANAISAEILR